VGTWTYSPETRLFSADGRTKVLHGLDARVQIDAERLMTVLHPDDRASIFSHLDSDKTEGVTISAEVRCVMPDGKTRWLTYRARYVADSPDGVQQWLGVVWDITAQREVEQELRASELRFRGLAENVPEILLTSPGDLSCDYMNGRASEYTGLPISKLLSTAGLEVIHPEDREQFLYAAKKCRETGSSMTHDVRGRRADGAYRWHRVKVVPGRDPDTNAVKWFGACSDIDDLKRLGEQLESKTSELQLLNRGLVESNLDLQQFAGIVAHDLQSPLNAIVLIGDELPRLVQMGANDDVLARLAAMMNSVARMQGLIRNVLDYSQLEWMGSRSFGPVDCNEILKQALAALAGEIRGSSSIVTFGRLPIIQASAEQIGSLFQNLIGNAIKYRKPGSAAHVSVCAEKREGQWLFTVSDNGIGIRPADRQRIFRIFERLGRRGGLEGAGIGLAICQRVIERHGGRIWVESELGVGSNFCFTLPAND